MVKSAYAFLASTADELVPAIALFLRQQTTKRQCCGSTSNAAKNGARSQPGATRVARRKYVSYHFTTGRSITTFGWSASWIMT